MARSQERTEFLSDIIIAAVEGGTGYWAQVGQYQYALDDGAINVYAGSRQGDETRATLHELNADADDYKLEGLELTLDAVASAISRIISRTDPLEHISDSTRTRIHLATRTNDAGDIDADDADLIAQVALLGEVVYG